MSIVLITGANRGIGFAAAKLLAQRGATVIATARDAERGKTAVEQLRSFGTVYFQQLDITDPTSLDRCARFVEEKFGHLDVLVNNAGINYDTWHNVIGADLEEVSQTIDTNLMGPWRATQAFLPALRAAGRARVINVSSGAGSWASQNGNTPGYSISKLALNALTRHFAEALQAEHITVNAMGPGWVRTDMGGSGASLSPEEGADTIVYLATDDKVQNTTGKFFRQRREVGW